MRKRIGFHSHIPNAAALKNYVDAVVGYMVPKGVSFAVMEINNNFRFKSFPQVSSGDITAAELSEACARLRAAGVEPIPLYNCYGHQGWNNRNSLLKAFLEFDETPWLEDNESAFVKYPNKHIRDENGRLKTTYTPAWCGNEPKVYDVVFPLIDELIEASGCKHLHLGMDEIFLFGECDRCRGMTPSELFKKNLLILREHCAAKGCRVMIWGDRLLDFKKFFPDMPADSVCYDYENIGTSKCIDELPKDIILCDWHYDDQKEHFSGELLSHGFTVIPACWHNPENAELLWNNASYEAEKQNCQDRLPGMLITCWEPGIDVGIPFRDSGARMSESLRHLPSVLEKVSKIIVR